MMKEVSTYAFLPETEHPAPCGHIIHIPGEAFGTRVQLACPICLQDYWLEILDTQGNYAAHWYLEEDEDFIEVTLHARIIPDDIGLAQLHCDSIKGVLTGVLTAFGSVSVDVLEVIIAG